MTWILGIDTSCDDTGVGLVARDDGRVGANRVLSQTALHADFGGVVPERASREHLQVIDGLVGEALAEVGATPDALAGVGATVGPGLVGALLVGLNYGKGLAWARGVPFLAIHHLEGHLAAVTSEPPARPHLALLASGGHTHLYAIDAAGEAREIGRTRDDAAGEAFDKVARLLQLPFPGGPALAELAERGDPAAVPLPRPMRAQEGFDFSFSGLKSAVARVLRERPDTSRADVAASFQAAVVDSLVTVTQRAARAEGVDTVHVAGGVAANARLRRELGRSGLDVRVPPADLTTDNGAMIAMAVRARLRGDPAAGRGDLARDASPYLPLAGAAAIASS